MNTPETALARQPARQSAKLGLGALSLITANAGLLLLYFVYDLSLFQLVLVEQPGGAHDALIHKPVVVRE